MLTLFTIPKAFQGHFGVIQRNALESWLQLRPACEVIVFGDDEGTAEVAAELGIRHVKQVERNEYGTPLLNSIFSMAEEVASHDLLCYVNADIIFLSDLMDAVELLHNLNDKFLAIGYRLDVEIKQLLDVQRLGWEAQLREHIAKSSPYITSAGMDYFIFPRGVWGDLPPFAIGRGYWDSWLAYQARFLRIELIDATHIVSAIHQKHDYSHYKQQDISKKDMGLWSGSEARRNYMLSGGIRHYFGIQDATHLLTPRGARLILDYKMLLRRAVTTLILFFEQSPNFSLCLWAIDALLRAREGVRYILRGRPEERLLRRRNIVNVKTSSDRQ